MDKVLFVILIVGIFFFEEKRVTDAQRRIAEAEGAIAKLQAEQAAAKAEAPKTGEWMWQPRRSPLDTGAHDAHDSSLNYHTSVLR